MMKTFLEQVEDITMISVINDLLFVGGDKLSLWASASVVSEPLRIAPETIEWHQGGFD